MTLVTFIIPVRHQDNARDWRQLTAKLEQTVRSISAQTHADWRGIIVANHGAALPPLPEKFSVTRVTFPPNDLHELGQAGRDAFLDAFRFDKGRRVLAGMLEAEDSRFTMICDDDDLVSNRIVDFVSRHSEAFGWVIEKGWLWDDGGAFFYGHDRFASRCGTCLIVRRDLYRIPPRFEDAASDWIKDTFGSHVRLAPRLRAQNTPLSPLPFRGAVYRVGNPDSHSRTQGVLRETVLNRALLKRPQRIARNLLRFRRVGPGLREEFFGLHASEGIG